jgi:hypothetical protein
LRDQPTRAGSQNFGERIVDRPFLSKGNNSILGHGVTLRPGGSGGLITNPVTPPSSHRHPVSRIAQTAALSEHFHITSDNAYTWDAIYRTIAAGLGVEANIVHVPTDTLIRYHRDWEGPLMGDKTWPALFDNTKVKQVAGDFDAVKELKDVLAEPIAHFKARPKPRAPESDELHGLMDLVAREQRALGHRSA